ncbi:MAG: hypothetical protein PWQ93_523 [Clostridiales bacterium]|jgi:DNA-binding MurR/RpiR family transcriptional regulator|nr:hypothetical protein [Clostridiales bacterium]
MSDSDDLLARIKEHYQSMSKGQKLIAEYIMAHYEKAAFMTASRIGEQVGVSESTVVRFADLLGYDGYPALQKALRELIRNKLTTVQRIEMSADFNDPNVLFKTVLKSDINNIRSTIEDIDENTFNSVIDNIFAANTIYILGMRSSAPLAQFLGYYLSFILPNVRVVTSGVSDVFEQMIWISDKDLLIGISFPRYSSRTIEAVQFAKERKAKIVAMTDSQLSPLTKWADYTLLARSDMASFVDSLVAPLSLINALIVAVGQRKRGDVSMYFGELEKIWSQYHVYVGKEKDE